ARTGAPAPTAAPPAVLAPAATTTAPPPGRAPGPCGRGPAVGSGRNTPPSTGGSCAGLLGPVPQFVGQSLNSGRGQGDGALPRRPVIAPRLDQEADPRGLLHGR